MLGAGRSWPGSGHSATRPRPAGSCRRTCEAWPSPTITASSCTAPASTPGISIGIFVNNIQVTFLAYAGGLTLGLLTGYVLATNGILLGVVVGLAAQAGNSGDLLRLLVGHGVLELSCIAVTAAAGLRVGWSLVEPGSATRGEALRREAGRSIGIVLGTMPLARPRRPRRGLRDGHVLHRGRAPARARAGRALLGAGRHARPRAFAGRTR